MDKIEELREQVRLAYEAERAAREEARISADLADNAREAATEAENACRSAQKMYEEAAARAQADEDYASSLGADWENLVTMLRVAKGEL